MKLRVTDTSDQGTQIVYEQIHFRPYATQSKPLRTALNLAQRGFVATIVVLGWQYLAMSGTVSRQVLPAPTEVIAAAVELWQSGDLQAGILISTVRAGLGLLLGVTIGTILGLVAGLTRIGENLIDTPVQMLRAVPILAVVPLFILWFGIGEQSKILMIGLATLFPIYLNLHAAIRGIDHRYFELAETTSLSRWGVVKDILLPGSLAGWLVGLRYSSGLAWLVLVVSEQVNAVSGLGFLMMDARQSFRTDIVILGIVLYGILGILTDLAVRSLEARYLRWRNDGRAKS